MSDAYVDVCLPGFIEASSAVQFGVPCVVGTRIPFYVGLGWVWEYRDKPETAHLTREQIIALAAFDAGYEWHKSRKRRQAMSEAVDRLWQRIGAESEAIRQGWATATEAIAEAMVAFYGNGAL